MTISFSVLYMVFCAIIFAAQPFVIEQAFESGFINMLPGNKRSRVMGRFLYSTILVICNVIIGCFIMLFASVRRQVPTGDMLSIFFAALAIGFIVSYMQNTLFYIIGKGKNQQLMGVIRIIPGFIVFFGASSLIDAIGKHSTSYAIIVRILENPRPASLLLLASSLIFLILGILISTAVIEKRDFN